MTQPENIKERIKAIMVDLAYLNLSGKDKELTRIEKLLFGILNDL